MRINFNRKSGLTLLELLISIGLLALIMAGITSSMGLGLRLFDRSATTAALNDEIAARVRLRGFLGNALPPSQIAPFPTALTGTTSGFAFTTLKSSALAPNAAALRIQVNTANDITVDFKSLGDDGEETPLFTATLSVGLKNTETAYFDATIAPAGSWLPNWSDETRLPSLVRITAEGGSPDWPAFVVRPTLSTFAPSQ